MARQPHFLGSMTLKALLDDPNLKNPPVIGQVYDQLKAKKEGTSDLPQFNYGSAFLGPNLWGRTLGTTDFNLEYMDLDEFLSENGIPMGSDDLPIDTTSAPGKPEESIAFNMNVNTLPTSPRQFIKSPPHSPLQYMKPSSSPSPFQYPAPSTQPSNQSSTPPHSPFNVDFSVSEKDLALTSTPDYGDDSSPYLRKWQGWTEETKQTNGQESFDPRKRNFTDEELKPQPVVKKSKKIFVPDDLKDEKYWVRRHKNNFAAKRSRDARRVKENQIAMRAAFLEKENSCLREEMSKLRKENAKLKAKVTKYAGTLPADGIQSVGDIDSLVI